MCIFAQPVVSVSDTNIFARLLPGGGQYLVYQMKFQSRLNNAIILPLPVEPHPEQESTLKFVSLQGHDRFFTDLDKGFPIVLPQAPASARIDSPKRGALSTLKVEDVGEFIASFVPGVSDFTRLDQQFRVPQESWDQIPRYSDYGFAVFQLKSLSGKPHPMAFRFQSRLNRPGNETVFFPTVHIHDGDVHQREEFDHKLYLQSAEFDKACGKYEQRGYSVADSATGYVRSKWPAKDFCDIKACRGLVDPNLLIHRMKMRGRFENDDVTTELNLAQTKRVSLLSPGIGLPTVAGLGGVLGLSWFFNRRNRIARVQDDRGAE